MTIKIFGKTQSYIDHCSEFRYRCYQGTHAKVYVCALDADIHRMDAKPCRVVLQTSSAGDINSTALG